MAKPPLPRPGHWEPDTNLIDHARMGGCRAVDLSGPERAWVVAGLTAEGLTAEETADRLSCSLRLIRQIRAEPMTVVATWALGVRDQRDAACEMVVRGERRLAAELAAAQEETRRLRNQRDKLVRDLRDIRAALPEAYAAVYDGRSKFLRRYAAPEAC